MAFFQKINNRFVNKNVHLVPDNSWFFVTFSLDFENKTTQNPCWQMTVGHPQHYNPIKALEESDQLLGAVIVNSIDKPRLKKIIWVIGVLRMCDFLRQEAQDHPNPLLPSLHVPIPYGFFLFLKKLCCCVSGRLKQIGFYQAS